MAGRPSCLAIGFGVGGAGGSASSFTSLLAAAASRAFSGHRSRGLSVGAFIGRRRVVRF